MIEVKNLVKRYGNHVAVDHLSFRVEDGQIYGFLGANGAGKSTTMNIMTGYIGATEGEVLIDGHDILSEPEEAKKCIGYLPELPPLYMDMKVDEYLNFVSELKKIDKTKRKEYVKKSMEMTGLLPVSGRLIRNLSKGYRQRVGLAQAIMGMPKIIILDEPTVGLDPKQIIEIRDLIRSLAKNHTVILSSHILSEVSEVCDHIMIISHGKLAASDTPENLMKMMDTSHTLELLVKGSEEQIHEVVDGVDEITSVTIKPSDEENVMAVSLNMKEDTDVRERLFYGFADARCPILMMKSSKVSLEDVFMELTADDEKARKEREAAEKEEEDLSGEFMDASMKEDLPGEFADAAQEEDLSAEFTEDTKKEEQ